MPENILQIIIRARDEATKTLGVTDKQLKGLGESVSKAGSKFLIAGTAMAAGLGLAIKKAGDFQEQMSYVATMLGEQSEKYMPGFESAIKKMAVTYGQSTATLSKGLYDILSASISAEKATAFLEVSVRAAEAGFVEAGLTADALTTVVNAYGLAADRAGDISDWFFSIVEKGKTTMAELAPTIGLVLPLSKALGVSLEEVGASLTVMTRGGIKTNIAITSLKALMGAFLKPTKELAALTGMEKGGWGFASAQAAMQQLGLTEVLKRLSKVEDARLPKLIEEKTALTGLLTILDKRNEFMEDTISISERAGKTDEMLAKRQDNLNVQMRKLRETVNILMVEVGTTLIPVIKDLAEKVVENIDKFRDFVKENEGLVKSVAILVPAITLLSGIFLKVVGTALKMVSIFTKLAPILGAIHPPVAALAIVFALFIGTMIKATRATKDFEKAAEENLAQVDKQIGKMQEWEGTHKALLLVKAKLLQRGAEETSEDIKNLDLRIAKLKEKEEAELAASDAIIEAAAKETEAKAAAAIAAIEATEEKIKAEEELAEKLDEIRLSDYEKATEQLEKEVEAYEKAGADKDLIDEYRIEREKERDEVEAERKNAIREAEFKADEESETKKQVLAQQTQEIKQQIALAGIEAAMAIFGKESKEGKALAVAKVLVEQGIAISKIWAWAAGAGPLGPILAIAQTALIVPNIVGQISKIQSAAEGKLFMGPALTTIAEKGPELAIPLNKIKARPTSIIINIQFPNVTTFSDWEEASPTRIKEVTRRNILPALQDLAREGFVI